MNPDDLETALIGQHDQSVWPGMLMPKLTGHYDTIIDRVDAGINELIDRYVNADGTLPDSIDMVIGGEIVTVHRVLASQFLKYLFTDSRVRDKKVHLDNFTGAITRVYGTQNRHIFGATLTKLVLDINTEDLTMDIRWEYTVKNSANKKALELPKRTRFARSVSIANPGQLHRTIYMLGLITGTEIRHDGVLPYFTVEIDPVALTVDIAKINED